MKRNTSRGKKIVLFILAGVVLFAVAGVIFISRSAKNLDALTDAKIEDVDLSTVPDGTHTGSYNAFPIAVTVEVTVKDGKITHIALLRHFNGQGDAAEAIPEKVVQAQSLQVDAISGATYSSRVILLAIENALKSAAGE